MKTPVLAAIVVLAGAGVGGGAAFGTRYLLPAAAPGGSAAAAAPDALPSFVPTGKILAPLVFPNGRLAGYVSFEVQLETRDDKVAFVTDRIPLLLHAVNLRSYKTPLASGPDGLLPDLTAVRRLLESAATETFGAGVVKRVAITQAAPA